jgi:hypothetical protein
VAVGFESKDKNRLRITYSETPSDEQFLIDGRVKLTDELTVQAAVDDSGNFRVRSLHEWGTNGISVAFGSSDTDFTSNVSFHTSQIWASTSYSESRGFGGRLVLGDIPKNRSDLFGEFSRPGANDISLVPDQTVRTFVGTAPAFGLLAFAPDTFLDDEPGSMVLDVRAQENVRASAQGTLRLGDLGPLQSSWVSAGAFYDLSRESLGGQVEIGTKIGAVDLRIQAEFNEQEEAALGLYLKVAF